MADVDDLSQPGQAAFEQLRLIDGTTETERTLLQILGNRNRADLRFGIDDNNGIYLVSKQDGSIRKLTVVPEPVGWSLSLFALLAFVLQCRRKDRN